MISKALSKSRYSLFKPVIRSFGAMGEIDRELLFEHKFTTDMAFQS
jgi:hypothetical protein